MGDRSQIEWCDATWNPIRGCTRVSEGCRNCYAERTAIRHAYAEISDPDPSIGVERPEGAYHGLVRSTPAGPRWTGEVRFVPEVLDAPLRWTKPRRIFVNSMSDLFHEKVTDEQIDAIFARMVLTNGRHTFQVLTKRPARMLAYMTAPDVERRVLVLALLCSQGQRREGFSWPLPNVHLGVSVENQAAFDERVELLGRTPAALRFLSMEPLLEEIECGNAFDDPPEGSPYGPIGWVIVGGESGPGARPCDLAWIRSVVAQAKAAGVPCFVKQLGARPIHGPWDGPETSPIRLPLSDRKGGDWSEWPKDLRVREFPT